MRNNEFSSVSSIRLDEFDQKYEEIKAMHLLRSRKNALDARIEMSEVPRFLPLFHYLYSYAFYVLDCCPDRQEGGAERQRSDQPEYGKGGDQQCAEEHCG